MHGKIPGQACSPQCRHRSPAHQAGYPCTRGQRCRVYDIAGIAPPEAMIPDELPLDAACIDEEVGAALALSRPEELLPRTVS